MNELYWVTIRDLCLSYNGPLVLSLSLSTLSFSQKTTDCRVQRHTHLLYFLFLMLINAYISTMSTVLSFIYDA